MKTKQITLGELREEIDLVDTLLIRCLAKRQEIVKEVAEIKKKENLPVFQPERERILLEKRKKLASLLNIDSNLVMSIFQNILDNSRKVQETKWR